MKKLGLSNSVCAFLFLLCVGISPAWAVGLGNIQVQSNLTQRFKARVPVSGISAVQLQQVKVSVAPPSEYKKLGIGRLGILNTFQFKAVQGKDGQAYIDISSSQAVEQPALSFLLQLETPEGKYLRSYNVLLDPPSMAEQSNASGGGETATASKAASSHHNASQNQQGGGQAGTGHSHTGSLAASSAAHRQPPESSNNGAPSSAGSKQSGESAMTSNHASGAMHASEGAESNKQTAQTSKPATKPTAESRKNTTKATAGKNRKPVEYYGPVKRHQTLWSIAKKVRPSAPDITMDQVMMALYQANPDAFQSGINSLITGSKLRVPSTEAMRKIDPEHAHKVATGQVAAYKKRRAAQVRGVNNRLLLPSSDNSQTGNQLAQAGAVSSAGSQASASKNTAAAASAKAAGEGVSEKSLSEHVGTAGQAKPTGKEGASTASQGQKPENNVQTNKVKNAGSKANTKNKQTTQAVTEQNGSGSQAQATGKEQATAKAEKSNAPAKSKVATTADVGSAAASQEGSPAGGGQNSQSASAGKKKSAEQSATAEKKQPKSGSGEQDQTLIGYAVGEKNTSGTSAAGKQTGSGNQQGSKKQQSNKQSSMIGAAMPSKPENGKKAGSENGASQSQQQQSETAGTKHAGKGAASAEKSQASGASAGVTNATSAQQPQIKNTGGGNEGERLLARRGVWILIIIVLAFILFGYYAWRKRGEKAEDVGRLTSADTQAELEPQDEASPTEGESPAEDGVHPLEDADFHISYGMYDDAIDILEQALQQSPNRLDYQLKLLEAYHGAEKAQPFTSLAHEVHDNPDLEASDWHHVTQMGIEVAPEEPLFKGESATGTADDMRADSGTASASIADEMDELERSSSGVDGSQTEPDDSTSEDEGEFTIGSDGGSADTRGEMLDFDLSGGTKTPSAATDDELQPEESAPEATEESESTADDLGIALEAEGIDLESDAPKSEEPSDEKTSESESDLEEPALEMDEADDGEEPGLEPDSTGEEVEDDTDDATADDMSTKLDLARAYLDMGDPEMAKSLLGTVSEKGTKAQKAEAEKLGKRID